LVRFALEALNPAKVRMRSDQEAIVFQEVESLRKQEGLSKPDLIIHHGFLLRCVNDTYCTLISLLRILLQGITN
jgi:hypothetical protein